MPGIRSLVATLALGTAAATFAPAAEAGHVVVGFGIGLPGVALYAPGYYGPAYYGPAYYGPGYALPFYGYYGGYGYYGHPYRYGPGRAYFHGHEGRRWR